MKIKNIVLALCAAASLGCSAQVMEKYEGMQVTRMSENGRWLLCGAKGAIICNRDTRQMYQYGTDYALGGGACISDNGVAVGAYSNFTVPAYWQDGEWHNLSHPLGSSITYGRADGISTDGRFIVGTVDCRALTKKAWPMVSPVLWELNEAGEYEFHLLPEPDLDVTGISPQQVSAAFVSDDGNTVLGQVTDYRGLMHYQIVYTRNADNEWTMRTSGDEKLVKEGAVWPPYPTRPTKPQAADYMTDAEKLAFNRANQAYKDSLEIVSLTGKNPRMPWYEDFVSERKEEFEADLAQYELDSETYMDRLNEFWDSYLVNITNDNFQFNSEWMSANGKYYASHYIYSAPAEEGVTEPQPAYVSPMLYTLDGSVDPYLVVHKSMSLFSVCDDGTMVMATPISDETVYSRTAYLKKPDSEELIPFDKWLQERSPKAYEWVLENMRYSVSAEESDTGEALDNEPLFGTIRLNADCSRALAYVLNPANYQYDSYLLDFDATESLSAVAFEEKAGAYCNAEGTLYFTGNPSMAEIFDLGGRKVWSMQNPASALNLKAMLASGMYLVRTTDESGISTTKIYLK